MDEPLTVVTTQATPITVQTLSSDKANIDVEYATKPHGGSKTPSLVIGLTIALLIIFGIAILVFLLFFNPPAMHEIAVVNNCSQNINVLFGVVTPTQSIEFFPVKVLVPKQIHYYKATPGTSIIVQGYRDNDTVLTIGVNPFTTVELTLAGQGFEGKHQVTDGTNIITNVHITANASDQYGVSVQGGYNIPISLVSSAFNNRNPNNRFSCLGPTWNHTIDATGSNECPLVLQSPGTGGQYQVCLSPCTAIGGQEFCCTAPNACGTTGGCQQLWDQQDYYTVFHNACPNCLITNCDNPNYTCGSQGGLTQYVITYCP
jgi:hypothetical protein